MATATALQNTRRFASGNSQNCARPQMEVSPDVSEIQGPDTWRIIFGSTAGWLPPELDNSMSAANEASIERCELCRQPIEDGEDFATNSVGQLPVHTRCLGLQVPAVRENRGRSDNCLGMLWSLLRHQPNG